MTKFGISIFVLRLCDHSQCTVVHFLEVYKKSQCSSFCLKSVWHYNAKKKERWSLNAQFQKYINDSWRAFHEGALTVRLLQLCSCRVGDNKLDHDMTSARDCFLYNMSMENSCFVNKCFLTFKELQINIFFQEQMISKQLFLPKISWHRCRVWSWA